MAQVFKHNLVFSSLTEVIHATAEFRDQHLMFRDSKQSALAGKKGEWIEMDSLYKFIAQLYEIDQKYGFVKDLFSKPDNTGKGGGKARHAGNTFYLLLANDMDMLQSQASVKKLVDVSWPLFLCLYPVKPLEKRSAALSRNLKARGVLKVCEFTSIQFPEGVCLSPLCRGIIHGAHIKPHSLGGSDRPENGIWLCEFHHRTTEGKLRGQRDGSTLKVRFLERG
jgi:hypothetical protein